MKVKLSQGELKKQRDALRQYERYLPTLQLKKQQIQLEILHQQRLMAERERSLGARMRAAEEWSGLLPEVPEMRDWIRPSAVVTGKKNVAGVDIPLLLEVTYQPASYDLFLTPLFVDSALTALREIVTIQEEARIIGEGIILLRQELRITTQRVNLFEKVKIPGAKEAIRLIRIYIGDQMTNAVGRSKIAKKKAAETTGEGVAT